MPFDTATGTQNALIPRTRIADIVRERIAALQAHANAESIRKEMNAAYALAEQHAARAHCGATFYTDEKDEPFVRSLDRRIWTHLLHTTGMRNLMDRTEIEAFEKSLIADVPEVSEENIYATFQRLAGDADLIFKRGLARVFSELDSRFKSHDAFKIGSRIIIERLHDEDGYCYSSNRAAQSIIDAERALAVLAGETPEGAGLIEQIRQERSGNKWTAHQSEHESRFWRIRCFKNGNAHLWFNDPALVNKANRLLSEYYGEVIPDAATKDDSPESWRKRSTAVAKSLQFYRTPDAVAQRIVDELYIEPGETRILEPSAGDGAFVGPLLQKGGRVDAVEIDADRCAILAARHPSANLARANFLTRQAAPVYDYVVMNPPFFGTHYMDHVRHAFDFLKPGGCLYSILPASAEVNESGKHEAFRKWIATVDSRGDWGRFTSLPAESFAESGTRIQTVILRIQKARR